MGFWINNKKTFLQMFIFHLFTCDFYIIINYNLNYTGINDYKIHKYMALLKACVFTDSIVYNINITRNIHKWLQWKIWQREKCT